MSSTVNIKNKDFSTRDLTIAILLSLLFHILLLFFFYIIPVHIKDTFVEFVDIEFLSPPVYAKSYGTYQDQSSKDDGSNENIKVDKTASKSNKSVSKSKSSSDIVNLPTTKTSILDEDVVPTVKKGSKPNFSNEPSIDKETGISNSKSSKDNYDKSTPSTGKSDKKTLPGTGDRDSGNPESGVGTDANEGFNFDWLGGKTRVPIYIPKNDYDGVIRFDTEIQFEFTVTPDGSVKDPKLLTKGASPELEKDAYNRLSKFKFNTSDDDKMQRGIVTFIYKPRR